MGQWQHLPCPPVVEAPQLDAQLVHELKVGVHGTVGALQWRQPLQMPGPRLQQRGAHVMRQEHVMRQAHVPKQEQNMTP